MYTMLLGIEHLMTGVQLQCLDRDSSRGRRWDSAADRFTFHRESASVIRVECGERFASYWPVNQVYVEAGYVETKRESPEYSHGEAQWMAQVMGHAMREADRRSYEMQTYTRRGDEYTLDGGAPSRLAPGEPQFTPAVIKAMRRKFGMSADEWLATLRWSRDHWFFTKDGMFHGVEPDGYIHT